ncbi:MAG: hypothetical protein LBT86_06335 [Deltaproteobacteria bacterium]|jgi:hypothetical protein|nr:hypothetical protein [Deltaproteobacteria bacterium]
MSWSQPTKNKSSSLLTLGLLAILALPILNYLWDEFRAAFFAWSAQAMTYPLGLFSPAWAKIQIIAAAGPPLIVAQSLAAQAGKFWLWLVIPGQVGIIIYTLATDKTKTYRRNLTAWDLVKISSEHRACLKPIVKTGSIAHQSPTEGPWRLADTPLVFTLKSQALLDKGRPARYLDLLNPQTGLPKPDRRELTHPSLDVLTTRKVFVEQLGPILNNLKTDLKNPYQELAMAFWAQITDRKDLTKIILEELSTNWDPQTFQTFAPTAQKIWAEFNPEELPKTVKIHQCFQNLFLMALLAESRKKGLLPTPLFIWLRPTNRALFYALNQMGGQIAWIEALGAWSHYLVENFLNRALPDPAVEMANKSLWRELWKEGWLKEPWPDHEPESKLSSYGAPLEREPDFHLDLDRDYLNHAGLTQDQLTEDQFTHDQLTNDLFANDPLAINQPAQDPLDQHQSAIERQTIERQALNQLALDRLTLDQLAIKRPAKDPLAQNEQDQEPNNPITRLAIPGLSLAQDKLPGPTGNRTNLDEANRLAGHQTLTPSAPQNLDQAKTPINAPDYRLNDDLDNDLLDNDLIDGLDDDLDDNLDEDQGYGQGRDLNNKLSDELSNELNNELNDERNNNLNYEQNVDLETDQNNDQATDLTSRLTSSPNARDQLDP